MRVLRHAAVQIVFVALCAWSAMHASAYAGDASRHPDILMLRRILDTPEAQIDFAQAKVAIDRLIDPSIDAQATLAQIDVMVSQVRAMVPFTESVDRRAEALRAYLYDPGPWNRGVTFSYDFSDPLGTRVSNKLLANYLRTRKGNCVSMPFLYIAIAQRLGLTVSAGLSPSHVFAMLRDSGGTWHNIETTSNGHRRRDSSYQKDSPMSQAALANGIYMRPLSKRETLVVMANVVAEHNNDQLRPGLVIAVADLMLERDPRHVDAMLHKGYAYHLIARERFISRYQRASDIPVKERKEYLRLRAGNRIWYEKAEELGWRVPPKDEGAKYMSIVNGATAAQR